MKHTRLAVFLLSSLATPFFVFGQTMSTSTAIQDIDLTAQRAAVQSQIDKMAQDFIDSYPTIAERTATAIQNTITIRIDPKNPGPNERVTATLVGPLTDLNRATIAWSTNGRVALSGVGKKEFSFQLGNSLQTTKISVEVVTMNDEYITKEFSFTPMGVSILWEADTYTPPFYKGKPLISPESRVRLIAIPDTERSRNTLGAGNLVYTWEKNMATQLDASGYGKNSFSFTAPNPYDKAGITVTVSSVDGSLGTKKRIEVPTVEPFVLFYEDHPLLGVWQNRTLGPSLSLTKKELSVSAEPFFFSNEHGETSNVAYRWTINGSPVRNIGRTLTLRNELGEKGESAVVLAVQNASQVFQSATRSLGILFTNPEQPNAFF